MIDIWQQITENLEQKLPVGFIQLWIRPLEGRLHDKTLHVLAPNEFVCARVRVKAASAIKQAAEEILGFCPSLKLEYPQTKDQPAAGISQKRRTQVTPLPVATKPRQEQQLTLPVTASIQTQTIQNWQYRFDDFVVGPCNNLAYVASQSFCGNIPGSEQLFLCSTPGLGKTHLIQAIGSELARQTNKNHLQVCYLSGEEFSNQLVMALKSRTVEQFKARFRNSIDLLLLEDVQFFQGKEKMQEELLNTLKSLQNHGRRVVMTSSFLPKELQGIDPSLMSRFGQGFMAVIDKPDYQTRLDIIDAKAEKAQTNVPLAVSQLLADRIKTDVRQLESCLKNIMFKARLLNMEISMDLAWEVLKNYDLDNPSLDLERIISFVCQAYGMSFDDLRSKSRKRDRVLARNTAFYLARKHTELSLADIGQRFNRRHSTVIKGIATVEKEVSRQSPLGNQLAHTIRQLDA